MLPKLPDSNTSIEQNPIAGIVRGQTKSKLTQAYIDYVADKSEATTNALFSQVLKFAKGKLYRLELDFADFGTAETADDFAQDATIKVLENLHTFSGKASSFYPWVHRLVFVTRAEGFNTIKEQKQEKVSLLREVGDEDYNRVNSEQNPKVKLERSPSMDLIDNRVRAFLSVIELHRTPDPDPGLVAEVLCLFKSWKGRNFFGPKDTLPMKLDKMLCGLSIDKLDVEIWLALDVARTNTRLEVNQHNRDKETLSVMRRDDCNYWDTPLDRDEAETRDAGHKARMNGLREAEQYKVIAGKLGTNERAVSKRVERLKTLLVANGHSDVAIKHEAVKRAVPFLAMLKAGQDENPNPEMERKLDHLLRKDSVKHGIYSASLPGLSHAEIRDAVGLPESTYRRKEKQTVLYLSPSDKGAA